MSLRQVAQGPCPQDTWKRLSSCPRWESSSVVRGQGADVALGLRPSHPAQGDATLIVSPLAQAVPRSCHLLQGDAGQFLALPAQAPAAQRQPALRQQQHLGLLSPAPAAQLRDVPVLLRVANMKRV